MHRIALISHNLAHRTLETLRKKRVKRVKRGKEEDKFFKERKVVEGRKSSSIGPRNNASCYNHWALCLDTRLLRIKLYLICIKLSFLRKPWWHILGLSLLLG